MPQSKEDWKVYGNVFSAHSARVLEKLRGQGHFEELVSPIKIGKEANVFSARTADGGRIAAKIYRLENCNFNKMSSYLAQDPRFPKRAGGRRQTVFAWTQREYRNLHLARQWVRVPTPLAFSANVLLMEFIGDGETPAPPLKDVALEDPGAMFTEIVAGVRAAWRGGLVHGDLSAFNILVLRGAPVLIDWSAGLPASAPAAREYLERDVRNLCRFFKKDPERTLQDILAPATALSGASGHL